MTEGGIRRTLQKMKKLGLGDGIQAKIADEPRSFNQFRFRHAQKGSSAQVRQFA